MSGLPQPGDTWNGRYEITAELGRGGFGRVYGAWDPLLERDVAIKMLRPSDDFTPTDHQRFRRETNIAASLEHRNIVTIYDGGEHDGLLYLVMRFVAGQDLRYELAEGPLDEQRAVSIVRQVGAALDYAHDKGLVHRDVKPGNVLCHAHSDAVYLADFGISRRVDQTTDNPVTQGLAPATLAYAAPEQMRTSARVDGRTDLYALGCVLFECLTGRKPFEGEMAAMITAHLHEAPPQASQVRPGLSRTWDRVIATAMAKDPADRFQRCAELTAAAEFVLPPPAPEPEPATATPPTGAAPTVPVERPVVRSGPGHTRRFEHGSTATERAVRTAADAPSATGTPGNGARTGSRDAPTTRGRDDAPGRTTAPLAPVAAPSVVDRGRGDTPEAPAENRSPSDRRTRARPAATPQPDPTQPDTPQPPPAQPATAGWRALRNPVVLVVAGLLVAGLVTWLVWPLVGQGDGAVDDPEVAGSGSAAGGGPAPLDEAQLDLLNAVGAFDEADCRPPTREPLAGEQVAVACTSADAAPTRVVFREFASNDERDAAFASLAGAAPDGECRDDDRARHGYEGTRGLGQVVCAVDSATAGLSWTVPGAPIMGSARLDEPQAADDLYAWWAEHVERNDG